MVFTKIMYIEKRITDANCNRKNTACLGRRGAFFYPFFKISKYNFSDNSLDVFY